MELNSIETWRWIWLAAAVGFAVGEIAVAGSFFLAPFAIAASLASLAAFAGASVTVSWLVFVAGSAAAGALLRPLAARVSRSSPASSVGSDRWVGREAVVIEALPAVGDGSGLVRLDREEWRAESLDSHEIPVGARVVVSRVDGTRLVVRLPAPSREESA